jgi:hypothetical protein
VAFAPELAHKSEGFDARYFATLVALEPGSFWFRARNRSLCWALKRYFPEGKTFLEVGFDTGFVLAGKAKVRRAGGNRR